MVEQCCRFVEQTPDLPIKLKLIDTLRTVTEGKVSCFTCCFISYLPFNSLVSLPSFSSIFLSPSPVSPSPYSHFPSLKSSPVVRSFHPSLSSPFVFSLPPSPLSHCLQIYVEVPRARLTMELSKIREAEGDIASAASILQELQVFINKPGFGSLVPVCNCDVVGADHISTNIWPARRRLQVTELIGERSKPTCSRFDAGIFLCTALHCRYRNVLRDSKYTQNTREILNCSHRHVPMLHIHAKHAHASLQTMPCIPLVYYNYEESLVTPYVHVFLTLCVHANILASGQED